MAWRWLVGSSFTGETLPQPPYAALLPISPASEVYRDRRRARRGGLWRHNHVALELDGVARHAMATVLNGHTPDYRCDRPKRMRGLQIEGTETLGSEEFFAVALEGDIGRDAVLAWAQVLLAAVGWRAVPNDAQDAPGALLTTAADVARESGEFMGAVMDAQADGHVDPMEAEEIARRARLISQKLEVTARVAVHQAAKGVRR